MKFDKVGLFCGFVSYPHHVDGRKLYDTVFSKFFEYHKEQWESYEQNTLIDYHDQLYKPSGYRLFGSQGLMILSLIDDYSFCTRHFNKNRIKASLEAMDVFVGEAYWDFNSDVVIGITDSDDCLLSSKAGDTFLKEKERFRFVGVIRLKFNPYFLLNPHGGINVVKDVKECINVLANGLAEGSSSHLVAIDCFDNDELTVISFSDDLLYLYNLLGEVRSITNKMLVEKSNNRLSSYREGDPEKHVFSSAMLYFGYDVGSSFDDSVNDFKARCKIETKVGHRDVFFDYLKGFEMGCSGGKALTIADLSKTITGGCSILFSISVAEIQSLEYLCEKDDVFQRDVKKVVISLLDSTKEGRVYRKFNLEKHYFSPAKSCNRIPDDTVKNTRMLLKHMGVSKMVRDTIMALFELFNKCSQDPLQGFYIEELKPSLMSIEAILSDLKSNSKEDVSSVEKTLNSEVTSLVNALNDRLCFWKGSQAPIEYNGGIHQQLTAFDYLYKTICQVFSPKEGNTSYVTITGADRASSSRMLFRLNINDVIFPELFVTTVWKEVANFHLKTLQRFPVDSLKEQEFDNETLREIKSQMDLWNTWHDLFHDSTSFSVIIKSIDDSGRFLPNDGVVLMMKSMMTMENMEYFFKDYMVYHFAFSRDIQKMWHYYLSIMLQTTSCYLSLNHLDKYYLVQMLLRLFMVVRLSGNDGDLAFVEAQKGKPFDILISSEWTECFSKVFLGSELVFNILEKYEFKGVSDESINILEGNIYELDNKEDSDAQVSVQDVLDRRMQVIRRMETCFKEGSLIEKSAFEVGRYEFAVCLLASYINASYAIEKGCGKEKSIRVLPRNNSGEIHELMRNHGLDGVAFRVSDVLVDPTGGFFIPSSDVRGDYFKLRSTFYKSIWDFRFRSGVSNYD